MNNLTDTEAQIIAILEEAGEEGLGTLINTVTTESGSSDEIEAIAFSLKVLLDRDLIQVAESRDKGSLQWHPLSKEESLVVLKNLMPFFQWSGTDKVWTLRESAQDVEILATKAGLKMARKILSEYGWDFWCRKESP